MLSRAEEVDVEEDSRYGQDRRGDELPQELAFREGRLEKIREAMAALEAESQAAAEQAETEGRKSTRVCRRTGPSATSPLPSHGSCPLQEVGTLCRRTTVRRWWTAPTG